MLVHDWPGFHRNDGLRGRWAVAQSTVGSPGVVVFPPFFQPGRLLSISSKAVSLKVLGWAWRRFAIGSSPSKINRLASVALWRAIAKVTSG